MRYGQPARVVFTLPVLRILIVIVLSLSRAGRVMRQRNQRRFEARFVTCRRVHVTEPPAPADVMHVPFSGLPDAFTGISGSMPFGRTGASVRITGLKLTFVSEAANGCSFR